MNEPRGNTPKLPVRDTEKATLVALPDDDWYDEVRLIADLPGMDPDELLKALKRLRRRGWSLWNRHDPAGWRRTPSGRRAAIDLGLIAGEGSA